MQYKKLFALVRNRESVSSSGQFPAKTSKDFPFPQVSQDSYCVLCFLSLFRLIHVCLSNNEVMPLWMGVLETETVFKNFIYILENSLNGELKKHS